MTSKQKEILKPYIDFKDHCIHRGLPFQTSEINLMSKFEVGLLNYFDEQNKNLTLSECIKEWNDNGFTVNVSDMKITISNCDTVDDIREEMEIEIHLVLKTIYYMDDVELTFDLQNLLFKTIKAVEVMKDE